MHMVTEVFGDVVVIHTQEDLDEGASELMGLQIRQQSNSKFVIDLDATECVSSSGLETLVSLQSELQEQEGDLRISAAALNIRKVLEITQLDQQLEVYPCIIDAVRSYD